MGVLVHLHDRFDPTKHNVYRLDRPVTVRRLVQKHKGLRRHTHVYRPGGVYGRRRMREFSRPTVCLFNGRALTRKEWKRTTVGPQDIVAFYAPPTGGGGLGAILSVVVAIAVVVASVYLGPEIATTYFGFAAGSFGAAAVSAVTAVAVGAIGTGLISLFATPAPPSSTGTGYANATAASSPVYSLTAQGNFARLQQPIPEAFGRNRMFPDFVTTPYVRYDDSNNQFLHHIVGLGIGEYEIEEDSLKLGDTPITSYDDISWAVIAPGELGDTDIVDERWITSQDLADIELQDAAAGSPWAGPYAANPPATTIGHVEVDTGAPRGLWAYNPVSTGLDGRAVSFQIQAQQIDDLGTPIGDPDTWEDLGSFGYLRTSQDPQRVTTGPLELPSAGRWQVRVRRTDVKDTQLQAGHQLDWIGLRGRVVGRRRFAGMTCVQIKMKAGAALNAAQSRQFNLVATRKLETWDSDAGAMGTVKAATRDPCDAFAYIARSSNGGRLRDDQVALADAYASRADFAATDADSGRPYTFDFVFDQVVTVSEALGRVARAVIGERVTQGGKLHLVRDVPTVAPIAMFSPRNIAPNSFAAQYIMVDSTSPDALIGTYIDQTTWQPVDVTVAFDDSAQERPSRMTLYGVGSRDQARAVLWNLARSDRYRRKVIGFSTAMEGLAVTFGDGISFSHDVPNYGQTLEVIDVDQSDPNAPVFTVADPPDFSDGAAIYYAAVRDSMGHKAGPFVATAVDGEEDQLVLAVADPDDLPEILTGGDKERTWLQLGPAEAYAKPLKIKQVTPRDEVTADIVAFDDDPRIYDPLPAEPEVPIGVSTDPITIVIHNSDGPVVNLWTLANDEDYSGQAIQQVTFTLAADVEVAIVRGAWPAGAVPILQLDGNVSGATGAAGAGGIGGTPSPAFAYPGDGLPGGAGGAGGTALNASTGALKLIGAGTIRGGKGGGGGGGGGGGAYYETTEGGGEGGSFVLGHLVSGGTGGAGNGGSGTAGTIDGPASGGGGGTGGAPGSWGAAGASGSAGAAGSGGSLNGAGGSGGPGGAGGKAIVGLANVDLSGFGGAIIGVTA